MAIAGWLIDKSALVRLSDSPNAKTWASRIEAGKVRISSITRLEIGYSARSAPDLERAFTSLPLSRMRVELLAPAIEERAWEVLKLLAQSGHHRAPSIPDLLIAATAERLGITVLHLDKDFEIIRKVTSQPMEQLKV